ncbi:ABC transporter ATP-binding protein [uncultured Megasphaera sp.]|uniref:ABC transporter ATP-binding protein n=1 Tax=uncultured Megasphaera sp. TaxID=165188 RepID=UPI0025F57837|nr:oligopeptide/dipeptide ABC transporter ATP-binding protein [uncultured Megasphaera sp.]
MALIEAKGLTKQFIINRSWLGRPTKFLTAVNRVSLAIEPGETVGLVGESGCGKSTFARTLLGLYPKTEGTIYYKGDNIETPSVWQAYRRQVQMIFQDPYASLDPRMTVEDIISEPLRNYCLCSDDRQRRQRVADLLTQVDLRPETAQRYPHEFSGGQRQRIGIARALAVDPECIFCDEPISALDVSVQVQIVNMLKRLQAERQLSYLFIAHDLSMVHHLSRRIGVMYLGSLVELGPSDAVFHHPLHPYTKMLIASVPRPDPHYRRQTLISGEVPSPLDVPSGCVFHPRCPYSDERCSREIPAFRPVDDGRVVACHHVKGGTD